METIEDIVREMRRPYEKKGLIATKQVDADFMRFADRIEKAHEFELAAERSKAAGEGYAAGKQSVTECNQLETVDLESRCIYGEVKEPTCEKSSQVGNSAKLREALVQCELFLGNVSRHGHPTLNPGDKCTACDGADELRGMVARALSEPLRNCDVGTAEEQEVRFRNYCWNHSSRDKNMECQCPIDTEGRAGCKLEWAQMPYGSEALNG